MDDSTATPRPAENVNAEAPRPDEKHKVEKPRFDEKDQLEFLIDKLERADRVLSRAWSLHMAAVGLSVLAVFSTGAQMAKAAKSLLQIPVPDALVPVLLTGLLVYGFIRFGFTAGQFLLTRRQCDRILKEIGQLTASAGDPTSHEHLFETTSFFEPFYQESWFRKHGKYVLRLLTSIAVVVLAAGHAAAVFLVRRAAGDAWLVLLISYVFLSGAVLSCYVMMWRSQVSREFKRIRKAAIWVAPTFVIMLIAGLLMGGWTLAPPAPTGDSAPKQATPQASPGR